MVFGKDFIRPYSSEWLPILLSQMLYASIQGEWIQAAGKADPTVEALVQAPDNTMNFFGRGNNTLLDRTGDYRRFYRTRFDIYELNPALCWPTGERATLKPEFTYYQKLGSNIVLSDRVGGGISIGSPAFYQSMFLGGQGNLLGYLQNRFAGQHMAYNNLQARLKLANIAGYILPGQLGLTDFYNEGRVWVDGEPSDSWHQGTGGGLYFRRQV